MQDHSIQQRRPRSKCQRVQPGLGGPVTNERRHGSGSGTQTRGTCNEAMPARQEEPLALRVLVILTASINANLAALLPSASSWKRASMELCALLAIRLRCNPQSLRPCRLTASTRTREDHLALRTLHPATIKSFRHFSPALARSLRG